MADGGWVKTWLDADERRYNPGNRRGPLPIAGLLRADEADVGAAGVVVGGEHGLLAGVAGAARECREAVLLLPLGRRPHAVGAIEGLEGPRTAAVEGFGGHAGR